MASGSDYTAPNYFVDEQLKNKLRVVIAIKGLKSYRTMSFNRIIPKMSKVVSNGDVVFKAFDRGFLFEFNGRDQLKGKHYRLHVDGLPGLLDVPKCEYRVEDDAIHLLLHKQDGRTSWLGDVSSGLPLVD
ncbi:hypothetical protein P879_00029 [Paragonimus westermani]|uniref:CS domain-containing protein n=1 Tax=Paragonimus westermani TaxID=34504 RepID=A0A8T0DWR2_9TREM|nr:hypothetical protein P879_00029 [Paragonimus westermani]